MNCIKVVPGSWISVYQRLPSTDEMPKCLFGNRCGDFITDAYIYEVDGIYYCENNYAILYDVITWMILP